MASVVLTPTNRIYVQASSARNEWVRVTGSDGDDQVEIYTGEVEGRAGNDVIRCLDPVAGTMQVDYWTSPKGVRVNLEQGWAEDGFGTRDTIVGATRVGGSQFDDTVWGSSRNDFFYGQAGHDFFDGGPGEDSIAVAGFRDASGTFRGAMLSELVIQAAADGRTFVVNDPTGTGNYFRYTLHDVEYIEGELSPGVYGRLELIQLVNSDLVAQQAVVAGERYRWNPDQPMGSALELTYSFMPDRPAQGQRAFTLAEQEVVRQILASVSQITYLTFREMGETDSRVGQIRFGVTQQTASKGYTVLPGAQADAAAAGDIFMDLESMLDLSSGSQGLEALIHEIGHALGLRHPVNVGPEEHWAMEAAARYNSTQYTVMAPTNQGLGLSRSNWGPLDVTALRFLYGTRLVAPSDTTIELKDTLGKSLYTLVDDGGHDALDCSTLSVGVYLNLTPGATGDVGLDAMGYPAVGNFSTGSQTVIEDVRATPFDDVIIGNASDNRFEPLSGNDWIDGGGGWDRVVMSDRASAYSLGFDGVHTTLAARDGRSGFKTLISVESLEFTDRQREIVQRSHGDFSDLPASVYQFFILAFGAAPGVEYLQQCADAYRAGADVRRITNVFCSKSQFTDIYPATLTHQALAAKLVKLVVAGSAAQAAQDQAVIDITAALDNGLGVGDMVYTVFSNLATKTGDALWGGTAELFFKQISVAKFYTEVMNQSSTDRITLAAAISAVHNDSDISNDVSMVALIGQGLLGA